MADLTFQTAGESHGLGLTVIVSGLPAGLALDSERLNAVLRERQVGYGRGGRQAIESDAAEIRSGMAGGKTLGSPLALLIPNRDHSIDRLPPVTAPRPGHADLAGCLKYGWTDARGVLERASARETAARTAAGAVAEQLLGCFGVTFFSHVVSIGGVGASAQAIGELTPALSAARAASDLWCLDESKAQAMRAAIDEAARTGDSLGGVFEVLAFGAVPGLGSPDRRLDGLFAQALMSIPAVKGVEIGLGFGVAEIPGSKAHDEIVVLHPDRGEAVLSRPTNRAGGLEGGMTNGEPIVLRAAMKPIPTLTSALRTVDLVTGAPADAAKERADTCAVPSASVVGRSVAAFALAQAYVEKFGGDTVSEMDEAVKRHRCRIEEMIRSWQR